MPSENQADLDKEILLHAPSLDTENLERLIRAGANINARDENGNTPLMIAADRGRPVAAVLLIEAGADVNAHNSKRETALTKALMFRQRSAGDDHKSVIPVLIAAGADVKGQNDWGESALSLAQKTGQPDIIYQIKAAARRAGLAPVTEEQPKGRSGDRSKSRASMNPMEEHAKRYAEAMFPGETAKTGYSR